MERLADELLCFDVVEEAGDRLVVFVDEDDDLLRWRLCVAGGR